jgi:hypothetical protein
MTSEGTPPDNERNNQDHSNGSYQQYAKRFPFLCAHGSTSHNCDTTSTKSPKEIQDIVITASLTPGKCLSFKTPFQVVLNKFGKDVQSGLLPFAFFA